MLDENYRSTASSKDASARPGIRTMLRYFPQYFYLRFKGHKARHGRKWGLWLLMKDLTVKTAEHAIADVMKLISIRVNFFQWFNSNSRRSGHSDRFAR